MNKTQAQRQVSTIWQAHEKTYREEEVTKRDLYNIAQDIIGETENWDAQAWYRFAEAIQAGAGHIAEWESIVRNKLSEVDNATT